MISKFIYAQNKKEITSKKCFKILYKIEYCKDGSYKSYKLIL